jgi:quercetin dioxygenase-like cupin family protein
MALQINPVPLSTWTLLPYEGCHGVERKVLLRLDHLGVGLLRFAPNSTIHEHAADIDIDVICVEGEGMTSAGSEQAALHAGEHVRWPAGLPHRLWTEGSAMITLMVEHKAG